MNFNLTDFPPLTSADVYATDKAFSQAINLWRLVLPLRKVLKWWQWGLLTVGVLIFLGGLVASNRNQYLGWKTLGLLASCVSLTTILVSAINLVRSVHKNKIQARQDELKTTDQLKLDELQFVLFRDAVPLRSRHPEHLVQLQEQIRAVQMNRRSLIAEHPLVLVVVALIVAGFGGLASQSDRFGFSVSTLSFLVLLLLITQLFPEWFVGRTRLENKKIEYLERLKFEPSEELSSGKLEVVANTSDNRSFEALSKM